MSPTESTRGIMFKHQTYSIPSHMNYGKMAIDNMLRSKDKVALINGMTGEQITFGELVQMVVNAASSLMRLGVERDEVVAVCSENRMEFLITAIAAWCSGATVTFLNAAYGKNELVHTMGISKPKYMFLSPETYKTYYETIVGTNIVDKFFIFGNSVNDPKMLKFNDLIKTFVDINTFRLVIDPINVGKLTAPYVDVWVQQFHNGKVKLVPQIFSVSSRCASPTRTLASFFFVLVELNLVDNIINNFPNLLFYQNIEIDYTTVTYLPGLARTALILYSSGTTGLPKGAKLSNLNLITAGNQPSHIPQGLIGLSIAPWSNTVGIMLSMNALIHNRTVLFLARFKEDEYLSCIQKYRAGTLLAVPPLIVMLTKSAIVKNYDVSSVKSIYCGGAPLDLAVIKEMKQRFKGLKHVLQGYGMTETTGGLTEENETEHKPGSVGKVVLGNIVKIADVETGKTLGPNQEGEVRVKGPSLFAGYIGKNLKDDLDEEGFFKTGDICYYDKDGYFYFVDRIKELIKYKAGQVAPSELEGILLQHPSVKDVGVVGKPDPLVGELPAAFVVKNPNSSVTDKELIDFVAGKVSSWKQLRGGVHFVEEIPKTPSGKILRRILRDYLKKPVSKL